MTTSERTTPVHAAVAIGSNLGDRAAHVAWAIQSLAQLPHSQLIAAAPPIETPPLSRPGVDVGGMYVNTVAIIETTLGARTLLEHLHTLERARGRDRERSPAWSARTLDLDLVLYGDEIIDESGLTIPHPRMHERLFVLAPLAAIAPNWIVPTLNRTISQLLAALPDASGVQPS